MKTQVSKTAGEDTAGPGDRTRLLNADSRGDADGGRWVGGGVGSLGWKGGEVAEEGERGLEAGLDTEGGGFASATFQPNSTLDESLGQVGARTLSDPPPLPVAPLPPLGEHPDSSVVFAPFWGLRGASLLKRSVSKVTSPRSFHCLGSHDLWPSGSYTSLAGATELHLGIHGMSWKMTRQAVSSGREPASG